MPLSLIILSIFDCLVDLKSMPTKICQQAIQLRWQNLVGIDLVIHCQQLHFSNTKGDHKENFEQ